MRKVTLGIELTDPLETPNTVVDPDDWRLVYSLVGKDQSNHDLSPLSVPVHQRN